MSRGLLLVMVLLMTAACSGLAGEPEIVATLPPQAPLPPTVPAEAVDLNIPGAAIYIENCAPCHGNTGRGDGPVMLTGSIPSIPNLTDATTMSVQTLEEYFDVITNGRMDKLMPPWENALTEEQRWEVTRYVFAFAHDDATVSAAAEGTNEAAAVAPAATEDTSAAGTPAPTVVAQASDVVGVVIGEISNGTTGGTVPAEMTAKLHIIDPDFNETTVDVPVIDGAFRFDDVIFTPDDHYVVTVNYQDMLFVSEIVTGNPAALTRDLSIDIFEPTGDSAVVEIDSFTTQVSVADGLLNVFQLVAFVNTSDRAYFDTATRTSVGLTLPEGAQRLDVNGTGRYEMSSDGRTISDTIPLLPGDTQVMHLAYTLPYTDQLEVSQPLPYALASGFEVLVDDPGLTVSGEGLASLGSRTSGLGPVTSYGTDSAQAAGSAVRFLVSGVPTNTNTATAPAQPASVPPTLAYVLIALGGLSIVMAGGLYVTNRRQAKPAATLGGDIQAQINALVQQIGTLDMQLEKQEISAETHGQRRAALKAQLMTLMQQAEQ